MLEHPLGIDYHYVLEEYQSQLIDFMSKETNGQVSFKPMVDTRELIDVAVAARTGVCFIGQNGLLITKEFGSYVYLGEIITNIPFEADTPVDYDCGGCNRCMVGCPTQALLGNGEINVQNVYLTKRRPKIYA